MTFNRNNITNIFRRKQKCFMTAHGDRRTAHDKRQTIQPFNLFAVAPLSRCASLLIPHSSSLTPPSCPYHNQPQNNPCHIRQPVERAEGPGRDPELNHFGDSCKDHNHNSELKQGLIHKKGKSFKQTGKIIDTYQEIDEQVEQVIETDSGDAISHLHPVNVS